MTDLTTKKVPGKYYRTSKCQAPPVGCIIYKHREIPGDRIWICPKPTELPVTDILHRCSTVTNSSRSNKYK